MGSPDKNSWHIVVSWIMVVFHATHLEDSHTKPLFVRQPHDRQVDCRHREEILPSLADAPVHSIPLRALDRCCNLTPFFATLDSSSSSL
jgi:hypothetical protein